MMAVSERGNETGLEPCVKVLDPGWNTVKVLGVCAALGPVLSCPWGICIDADGNVLVADWGEQHRILLYPPQGVGWSIVNQGLSSPRGLTLLPEGQLVVSDSMHHCIKIYQYKAPQD
ncbi:NHL-repeat-containing protein 4-like [Gouania willdenowi]|uniref:NHL repeat-containing protein n=1 Tax=Gouania willdenowi TaxID=441366 RepID=A0A8C5EA26_GOUWI|nr:NHL-repeat-containing protein 4 [Gouania willdenowi]